jgi:hypothetical protein
MRTMLEHFSFYGALGVVIFSGVRQRNVWFGPRLHKNLAYDK